jgi:type IV pilus assembly protein PilA
MLKRLRERAGSEKGFTLIELLVVMLIRGILAAIAIPAFLNQKGKANDSQMKVQARSMQTAMETYSTDHNGQYTPTPTVAQLQAIEPTIQGGGPAPVSTATTYTVTSPAASGTGNVFSISRLGAPNAGKIQRDCGVGTVGTNRGQGACSSTATVVDGVNNYW